MSNKITYRRDKKSQLTSNEVDDNFKYLDERIDKVSEKDYIIYDAGYASSVNAVTVNKGCKWKISGVEYSNVVDQAFAVQRAQKGMYRVDIIYLDKNGVIDIKTGTESKTGYEKARVDALEYLYVYVNDKGVQRTANDNSGDYVSKLAMSWVDVDHDKAVLQATEQGCNINIIGGNKIIDTVANGIFEISVPATFSDGYEVAIRNLRSSYLTLVNSAKLRIYTGQNYTVRPGEIVVFKYDKREQCFAVSGALDIRLDWQNVDEIIGVDSMRMVVDSSAGDALNPNDLNTKLTPTILRYFKDYTSDAVGWQWKRFSGDEAADTAWAKGKTKRVLELTPVDFTDAINKGNVSFMCEAIVNNADVVGVWVGKLVDTAKTIRIQSTGTQFKGSSPEYILLRAIANNIQVKKTEWFKDDVLTNISDSMMVYNNQVSSFVVMKLRVTGADGVVYEDAITLSKVVDGTNGKPGVDGKQGAVVVWTEWMTGSKHYNNDKEIYYIYHRPTQTVWKLKDGYNDIVAPANPDARYVQQPHLEQVVTKVLVAEGANIAGFIFKDGKMVSQYPSPNNPDLILDGVRGEIVAKKLTIVPGSPADKFIDDKIGGIEVGGRNLLYKSGAEINHSNSTQTYQIARYAGNNKSLMIGDKVTLSIEATGFTEGITTSVLWVLNNAVDSGSTNINTVFNFPKGRSKISKTFIVATRDLIDLNLGIYNHSYQSSELIRANNKFIIHNLKLEKGNVVTDWTPAIEDTEAELEAIREKNRQQERDINNLNNTTNILNQKTNYLTTTTTGNVVTTGTTEVGDANGNAKAGMTGVVSPNPVNISQNRRVVFYAGTGFANRENAKVQIWDDGLVVLENLRAKGHIDATSGTFSNVTANNLTVNNGVFNSGKMASFTVSGDFITTERFMYVNTKSVMKLGGGGLQVDFMKGTDLIGRIDTTGSQLWSELHNLMEIKSFGETSQGVAYNSLYLESSRGYALRTKGRVYMEGSIVINALDGDAIQLLGPIAVSDGGNNIGHGFTGVKNGMRFINGIMVG